MPEEKAGVVRGVRCPLALPGERAGRARTAEEHFFVRFPAVYQWVANALTRLSPRSPIRRLMLRRFAGRTAAAVNRRDFDVFFLGIDPEIEYHPAGEQRPPGMHAVARGRDGYREVWRQLIDSFEDFHAEPEELLDLGEAFLGTTHYVGHGSGSGVPVDVLIFQLFKLRRGLVVWQRDFSDRSEALEAAARLE